MKHARDIAAIVAALILSVVAIGCSDSNQPRIGVALYSFDDAFISAARRAFEAEASGKARLQIVDGQNKARVQSAQIETMVEGGANVLIVNPVDRSSSAGALALRAKSAGIPMIFFGREPPSTTVNSWSKIYYLGVHTDEATAIQAEMLRDYCAENPSADLNGDGNISYVILRGESNYIDVATRDSYRDRVFEESSVRFAKLADATANWSRADAQRKMTEMIARHKGWIEAVLCDNDEMALGAVAAFRIAGYMRTNANTIPILGIDATPVALEAVKEGLLLGTLRSDAEVQGRTLFKLALDIAQGKDLSEWALQDGKYYYLAFQKVTRANVSDYAP